MNVFLRKKISKTDIHLSGELSGKKAEAQFWSTLKDVVQAFVTC